MTLLELLCAIEWGGKANPVHHQCPLCGELRMVGHQKDCELALYLKAARVNATDIQHYCAEDVEIFCPPNGALSPELNSRFLGVQVGETSINGVVSVKVRGEVNDLRRSVFRRSPHAKPL